MTFESFEDKDILFCNIRQLILESSDVIDPLEFLSI